MFKSARFKLTFYYLLIIMTVSILFSIFVYRMLTVEIARSMRQQALRNILKFEQVPLVPGDEIRPGFFFNSPFQPLNLPENFHQLAYQDARRRVALDLLKINILILIFSGLGGYFLAGETLKPIALAMEKQKRFVADASHELRTPLTAIKTETEVTLRDKKLDLASAKTQLTSNLEEIEKLKALTDYFLTLSIYEDGATKLTREELNLNKVLDEAVYKTIKFSKEKNIKVEKNYQEIFLWGNKTSLVQLFSILLENAVKYSLKNGKIMVENTSREGMAFIKIIDFGTGIAKDKIPFIFDRFYRAETARSKEKIAGYGLGLSIAKRIVTIHGGQIEVESKKGMGTTFVIILPITKTN